MLARASWSKTLRRLTSPLGRRIELLEDRSVPASLELAISPAALHETTGTVGNAGTVTRVGFDNSVPLVVNLSSSDTTEVAVVTSTVTIPAGAASAPFGIRAVDDTLTDGTQTAVITATAQAPGSGPAQITGAIAVDPSFGGNGYVYANGVASAAAALQPDGKLVTASVVYGTGNNLYDIIVRRFTTTGALDTTFAGGEVVTDVTGQKDMAEKILIQPDGSILVLGTGLNGPFFNAFAVRYTGGGALDTTFGTGGKVVLNPAANQTHEVWDAALQPDGKIVLAGMFNYQYGVARLNADGSLDTSFGTGGYSTTSFVLGGGRAFGVALQPDGKIVTTGTSWGGNFNSRIVLARFNPDGTLDTSFDGDGKAETDLPNGQYDGANDVVIQPSGRIVVAGRTGRNGSSPPIYDLVIVGYTPAGALDTTFASAAAPLGYNVTQLTSTGGMYGEVRLALQADGRLLAAAASGTTIDTSRIFLARYSANGLLENTANGTYSASRTEDLVIDAAGGIYVPYTYGTGANTSGWVDKYKTAPTTGGVTVSATATVTVADNEPFAAVADSYTLNQGTTLTVAGPGVLANDVLTNSFAPTAVGMNQPGSNYPGPTNGTLTLNPDGSFTYTPNAGFYGTDRFYYRVVDGAATTTPVAVTLTVNRTANTAPVAVNDSYTIGEDRTLTTVLTPEAAAGNSLTMTSDPGDYIGQGLTYGFGSGATFSMFNPYPGNETYRNAIGVTVSQGTNQYWSLYFWAPNNARFVPGTTYTGAARFPFNQATQPGLSVSGNSRGSNTLTGFFTVSQAEYDAAGALTRFAATFEQHSEGATPALRGTVRYNFQPSPLGVLANDTDPENDPRTAVLVSGPANGTLSLNSNGTFSYTPNAGWSGTDTFTYTANDFGLASAPATVTITVTPENDVPIARPDAYTTDEETPLSVQAPGYLVNDTDEEGATLVPQVVTYPTYGTLAWNSDGAFLYTPNANFFGTDTFRYRVSDGTNWSDSTTVTITVNNVYDPPFAGNNVYTVVPGVAFSTTANNQILLNDGSPDGRPITAVLVAGPTNGTLTLNPNGNFTYTRNANATGPDSFTYQASDGIGLSNVATVKLNVAPGDVADFYAATEDTPLVVSAAAGVVANDTDPDGDALTASLWSNPTYGTVGLSGSGAFTYTPRANWSGTDTFTYKAYDGTAYGPVTTVTITVAPVNDAPVATNDAYATSENVPVTIAAPQAPATSLNMVSDSGDYIGLGQTYAFTPGTGTFTVQGNSNYLTVYYSGANQQYWSLTFRGINGAPLTPGYYPNAERAAFAPAGKPGLDITAQSRGSNTVKGDFTVLQMVTDAAGNVIRFAVDFTQRSEGNPNAALRGQLRFGYTGTGPQSVLVNDTDVDNDPLSAVLVSGPSNGTLSLNANGAFVYTPNANFVGTDSFTYKANDGTLDSNVATATISVAEGNDIPTAADDAYTVGEDLGLSVGSVGVLANDSDADNDPLTAVLVSGPAHGTLTLNPNGSFAYTPATNFNGTDTFTYRASDGVFASAPATVTITVTPAPDAPTAAGDAYTVGEDLGISVGAPGVLGNDTDPENDPLTAVLVTGPSHGTLTLNPNGSFDYTPFPNWNGTDSFTYKANDGGLDSNVATVTITVTPANDAPTAADDSYTTAEDTLLTVAAPGLLGNDSDVDNDPLTVTIVATAAHGYLQPNADGSFTYTPHPNYFGTDTFTYRVTDGTATSSVATVTITVTPVNDAPAPQPDAYTTTEDGFIFVATPGVLANDFDPETDPFGLTAVLVSGPAHAGTFTFNANGSYYYEPAANWNGTDTFTYQPFDGQLYGPVTTVTITATAVNDAPVAANNAYTVAEDGTLTVAAPGVLGNDTDIDSPTLTAVLVAGPANGTLTLNPTGGFVYTPPANYNGTVTFTYKANDGALDSNAATVTITVTPVNDAPVAVNNTYTTSEDTSLTVAAPGVLGNDTDVENSPLTAVLVSGPGNGTFSLSATGGFVYTPPANYNGTVTFTYKASDGALQSNVATVTIVVTPVNDTPVAATSTPSTVTVAEGTAQTFNLSASSDPDGDPLSFTWDFGDGSAVTTTGPGGSNPGVLAHAFPDNGTYTVRVTVRDPAGLAAVKTFTANVTNANPGGALTGPTQAVPGLELVFTATATDPGAADLAANFTYLVTWGDGTTATQTGPAGGVTFKKTYSATATFTPTLRVTDKDGGQATVSAAAVAVTGAAVIGGTLYVGGTTGNDTITVSPTNSNGTSLTVVRNGTTLGTTYAPTGDVVVYGLAGGDNIDIATKKVSGTTYYVARPVYVFGGDGNDDLDVTGASAGSVVSGGAGTDTLTGGNGRDILIGGAGADTARGGNGEEILIGGIFDYETDLAVLRTIGAEWWRTDATFAQRIAHLKTGGGLNGSAVLTAATIDNDSAADQLYGQGGNDWFLAPASEIKDFAGGDDRTLL